MKALVRFFSHTSAERLILLRLSWYLIRTEIVLSVLPYSATRRLVLRRQPIRCLPPYNPRDTLHCHFKLLEKLCRNLPWTITCLRQAVALRDSLAADGVEAILKIGLCSYEGKHAAHAWLECCGLEILKNGFYSELTSITEKK